MNTTDTVILDALRFERSHWQAMLDRRRPAKNSPIKVWARDRVEKLQAIIDGLEVHEMQDLRDRALQAQTNDWR
jgi:hypothetical protein